LNAAPIRPPPATAPAQHGFGFHNEHGGSRANEPPTRENPETLVHLLEARPRRPALQDQQLLPEAKIIGDQQHLWLESRSNSPQQSAKHTPLPLLSDGKKLMVNVVNEMPSGLQPGFRHRAHVS
jgi:hypothetical protein